MGLVNTTLSGLYNGISQQAPPIRVDTQAQRQENISSSLTEGIIKRPNTTFISSLASTFQDNVYIHTVDRDSDEEYLMIFTGDPLEPLEIFTFDGIKCTLDYEDGQENHLKDYLTTKTLLGNNFIETKKDIKTTTVGDNTLVVNRQRYANMDTTSTTKQTTEDGTYIEDIGLVYIKKGFPETDYNIKIVIGGTTYEVTYTTPLPTSDNVEHIKTNDITAELKTLLDAELPSSFTITADGSIITMDSSDKYTLETSDSFGDSAMAGIKGSVQNLQRLPPKAPEGYILKVQGETRTIADSYYVKFIRNEEYPSGIWEETKGIVESDGQLLVNEIDTLSMPKTIIRESQNNFRIENVEWDPRRVGNDVNAPYPSFIDSRISDVFFFQNRLGFLSGESVIISRSGDYFNFFNGTASEVLDTDPIDVTVSTKDVTKLQNAIPYAGQLLLFSTKVQFVLNSGDSALTPKTVAIDPSTYFDTNTDVEPVGAGPNIYFLVPFGRFSSIREYYIQENARTNNANNITSHVPSYLPDTIDRLVTSSARDMLLAIDSNANELYIYKYQWRQNKKIQSAWSKWNFPEVDEVLDAVLISSYLFIVARRGSKLEILRLELEDKFTGDLPFRVFLDYSVSRQGTYDGISKSTTWDLPYSLESEDYIIVNGQTGLQIAEQIEQPQPNQVEVLGDYTDNEFFIGIKYNSVYEFSKFYIRDNQGKPKLSGRVQMRSVTLTFTETASFKIISETNGGRETVKPYNGIILGETELGTPSFISGEASFPILAKSSQVSVRLESDSYLPFRIHTASFEAMFTERSKHV